MNRLITSHKALTLPELMIATAIGSMVLATLLTTSIMLQRMFRATQMYSNGESAQQRIADYMAMDLRRAVGIGTTAPSTGVSTPFRSGLTSVIPTNFLTITVPGYYQNPASGKLASGVRYSLISTGSAVAYGTSTAVAPNTTIRYEKTKVNGSLCFVRREGSQVVVLARDTEDMDLDLRLDPTGRAFAVEVWLKSPFSTRAYEVAKSDRVMLRNARQD